MTKMTIFSDKDSQWCRAISDMAQYLGSITFGRREKPPTGQTMSRQEFEEEYARRSGVTIEWLREIGKISLPCDCGEEGCQGWQMRGLATIHTCDLQFIPDPYRSEVKCLLGNLRSTVPEGLPELLEALANRLFCRSGEKDYYDQQLIKQARKAAWELRTIKHQRWLSQFGATSPSSEKH